MIVRIRWASRVPVILGVFAVGREILCWRTGPDAFQAALGPSLLLAASAMLMSWIVSNRDITLAATSYAGALAMTAMSMAGARLLLLVFDAGWL